MPNLALPDESFRDSDADGFDPAVVTAQARDALEAGNGAALATLVAPLHPADLADLIETLPAADRPVLTNTLDPERLAEVLPELHETVRVPLVEQLPPEHIATALTQLDSDDVLGILEDLDEEQLAAVLSTVDVEDRAYIETGLSYPEDTAGRLMQQEVVAVPRGSSVGGAIDRLRRMGDEELPTSFFDMYVVDADGRFVGAVPVHRMLLAPRAQSIDALMVPDAHPVEALSAQSAVAHVFRQYDVVSVPVVDAGGRLVGMITADDVVDVIDEEADRELMNLARGGQSDPHWSLWELARARFTWLFVNLGTAVLASAVIGLFEAAIDQVVALAVLMPIVASMGGNAGTQSLTVTVRGLAMKEIRPGTGLRFLCREMAAGGLNGIAFAVVGGLVAGLWFGDPWLAVVFAVAMIVTLLVASLVGTAIPFLLQRLRIDPAVASGVILTTATDVVGFFAFLGLAAVLLLG